MSHLTLLQRRISEGMRRGVSVEGCTVAYTVWPLPRCGCDTLGYRAEGLHLLWVAQALSPGTFHDKWLEHSYSIPEL